MRIQQANSGSNAVVSSISGSIATTNISSSLPTNFAVIFSNGFAADFGLLKVAGN